MTQSSGRMDATICSKCCKRLDPSQRCSGADCQAAEMAGRSSSKATQATLWKSGHPSAATPWSMQNKVASTKPAMATSTIGLRFRGYVYGAMFASCDVVSRLYLDVERGAKKSTRSGGSFAGLLTAEVAGRAILDTLCEVCNFLSPSGFTLGKGLCL